MNIKNKKAVEQKSIGQNMIYNTLLTVSNFLFPLLTFPYVSRVLSAIGPGRVAYVNSIINYFLYFSMLGIPAYGLRECVKVRDDREKLSQLYQELLCINLVSTIIAYVGLFLAVIYTPKFLQYKNMFISMCMIILLTTIGVEWLYKALEEYRYITLRSLVMRGITVVLTFIFVRDKNDYIAYGILTVFATSASYIFNLYHVRKYVDFKITRKLSLKKHLTPILILFASTIILTIYNNFDISMLGSFSTEDEVGVYNAALKIKNIILALSTSVTAVMISRMVDSYAKNDMNRAKRLLEKSIKVSMVLALPLLTFVAINAKDIIVFICGKDFVDAVPTLRVLCICIVPLILTNVFGNQVLIPLGMEKRFTISVFIGLIINIILNMLLIFRYGATGAAVATLASELWNVYYMGTGRKDIALHLLKAINYFKYILPLVLSVIAFYLISPLLMSINIFFRLVLSTLTFFGTFYTVNIFLREEIICQILRHKILAYLKK